MEKMSTKMKAWYEKHKDDISKEAIRVSWYLLGLSLGYFVGSKLSEWQMDSGLSRLHDDGIMKFFDPAKGIEVDVTEATKIVKQMYK